MTDNYIDLFLDMMVSEKGASINTINAYERDIKQFLEQKCIYNIEDISKAVIEGNSHGDTVLLLIKRHLKEI